MTPTASSALPVERRNLEAGRRSTLSRGSLGFGECGAAWLRGGGDASACSRPSRAVLLMVRLVWDVGPANWEPVADHLTDADLRLTMNPEKDRARSLMGCGTDTSDNAEDGQTGSFNDAE